MASKIKKIKRKRKQKMALIFHAAYRTPATPAHRKRKNGEENARAYNNQRKRKQKKAAKHHQRKRRK